MTLLCSSINSSAEPTSQKAGNTAPHKVTCDVTEGTDNPPRSETGPAASRSLFQSRDETVFLCEAKTCHFIRNVG